MSEPGKVNEVIILSGVSGSGKSTVAEKATEDTDIKIVTFGTVIAELLKADGLIENRDEIRAKVSQDDYIVYQKKTAEKLAQEKGRIIVDTHLSLMTPTGFYPGFPQWIIDRLTPNLIVIIEATPEEITARRNADKSRKRGYSFETNVKEHQEFNRMYASVCSVLSGARIKIIKNGDGELESAVREFKEVLK
ncbi:MAG: adenylate kinase [Candidatus Diapherotrites archaeon]|nr:adenylate kinase [Candidatus Diapherotrites archaeon]